jgi:hypothetical protein
VLIWFDKYQVLIGIVDLVLILQAMSLLLLVPEDSQRDYELFLTNLKIYKLPKLMLRLADYAHHLNPAYENVMTTYRLEHTAAAIVTKGCYDYRDEITCHFHRRV